MKRTLITIRVGRLTIQLLKLPQHLKHGRGIRIEILDQPYNQGEEGKGLTMREVAEKTPSLIKIIDDDKQQVIHPERLDILDRIVLLPEETADDLLSRIVVESTITKQDTFATHSSRSMYQKPPSDWQNEAQESWRSSSIQQLISNKVSVRITEKTLLKAMKHAESDPREVGGICVGKMVQQGDLWIVSVTDTFMGRYTDNRSTSITFTPDTWSDAIKRIETEYLPRGESMVGWYHTHPGFGVFFSSWDLFFHENFFTAPWHIALVIDPHKKDIGFFGWSTYGKPHVTRCSYEVVAQDNQSLQPSPKLLTISIDNTTSNPQTTQTKSSEPDIPATETIKETTRNTSPTTVTNVNDIKANQEVAESKPLAPSEKSPIEPIL